MKQEFQNKHNKVRKPNWRESDQLSFYKYGRGVNLQQWLAEEACLAIFSFVLLKLGSNIFCSIMEPCLHLTGIHIILLFVILSP